MHANTSTRTMCRSQSKSKGSSPGLTPDLERRYRNHIEYWDTEREALLDETADPESVDAATVIPANSNSRFTVPMTGTRMSSSLRLILQVHRSKMPSTDLRVTRADKRRLGFIYLRALTHWHTGT